MIHITGNDDDRYRQEEEHAARRDAEAARVNDVYSCQRCGLHDAVERGFCSPCLYALRAPRCLCCAAPLAKGEYCDGCEMEGLATQDRQNREALGGCPNPEETDFLEPEDGE